MEKTIVVFRKFKDGGDLIALFPAELNYSGYACESYQRGGQHEAADYTHCINTSTPATPKEYASLKKELENVGYVLDIRKRFTQKK